MYDKPRLLELFRTRALKFGDFTLASGKKAKYYLDGKQITLHSEGLRLVSEGLYEMITQTDCTAVGGMSIGADPIVAGILIIAAQRGKSLDGFLVRKEAKGHGTQRFIEGPLQPGAKVAIVEDVVTTGGSSLLAVERVQEFGAHVSLVGSIIDRMEGGAQNFAAKGLAFKSLLTIQDFGLTPPTDG